MILPDYISLRDWANSLLIDFPADNLPILYNEEEWKDWGNEVVFSPSFEKLNSPGTAIYENWRDWAVAVYNSMWFQG
jgi:hypothetical protein